ncbi:hypothetical protein C8F04DRAFT_1096934 [Mycena alexandri]|uniref:DUF6593 domain-containing protein n=1 Tax=Mycena alexandri TaxID=1745969 RepID=A0AAD6SXW1_9AGAR|nr:hypothetical protein C8F04DRAFT_1096934 [Mycena alexandri]
MSIALTFTDKKLVDTALVAPDGAVHYTTSTTHGLMGRKTTTVSAASGLVGFINWREKIFSINGVQQKWEDLKERSNGIFSSEREWHWGSRSYKLKYHNAHKELLATPNFSGVAGTVRFTVYEPHLFHENQHAVIHFPHEMQDEIERMFVLMAILQMEMHRQDQEKAAAAAAAAG